MSSAKKNYIYQIIYRVSICILPLVITPYLAHTLSPDGNGLYAFSSAVACYFIMFAKLGLDHYGSKTIALCGDDKEKLRCTFWSIYSLQICTALVSSAVYLVLACTVFAYEKRVFLMQFLYVVSSLFDISWFFFGLERFRVTTVRSVAVRLMMIAGVFLFVRGEEDVWVYTLVMAASFLLEQVILLPFAAAQVLPVPRITWADVRHHILPNLKLFLPLAALSVYHWMDKLMLGVMTGSDAVAYYNYADSIINLPKGIVVALGTVMLPRISRLARDGSREETVISLKKSVAFICFICCVLCFGIAGIAPVFVPWFLGPQYTRTVTLVMELALVMIPMSLIDTFQMQYLIPCGLDRIYIRSVIAGAIANLTLNSALIPFLGENGAVIGTIGAETVVCAFQMTAIRKEYGARDLFRALWPFFLAGMLEFAAVYSMGKLALPPLLLLGVQLLTGAAVYFAACTLFTRLSGGKLKNMLVFISEKG